MEKMAQNDKKLCPLHFIFQDHTSYDLDLWYTMLKHNISRGFLHFFHILIFGVNSGVKEQKMV